MLTVEVIRKFVRIASELRYSYGIKGTSMNSQHLNKDVITSAKIGLELHVVKNPNFFF